MCVTILSSTDDMQEVIQLFRKLVQLVETSEQQAESSLVLTTEKAAKLMEISIPTLREHFLCRPDFPKVWAGSKCLIPKKALEEWLNRSETHAVEK